MPFPSVPFPNSQVPITSAEVGELVGDKQNGNGNKDDKKNGDQQIKDTKKSEPDHNDPLDPRNHQNPIRQKRQILKNVIKEDPLSPWTANPRIPHDPFDKQEVPERDGHISKKDAGFPGDIRKSKNEGPWDPEDPLPRPWDPEHQLPGDVKKTLNDVNPFPRDPDDYRPEPGDISKKVHQFPKDPEDPLPEPQDNLQKVRQFPHDADRDDPLKPRKPIQRQIPRFPPYNSRSSEMLPDNAQRGQGIRRQFPGDHFPTPFPPLKDFPIDPNGQHESVRRVRGSHDDDMNAVGVDGQKPSELFDGPNKQEKHDDTLHPHPLPYPDISVEDPHILPYPNPFPDSNGHAPNNIPLPNSEGDDIIPNAGPSTDQNGQYPGPYPTINDPNSEPFDDQNHPRTPSDNGHRPSGPLDKDPLDHPDGSLDKSKRRSDGQGSLPKANDIPIEGQSPKHLPDGTDERDPWDKEPWNEHEPGRRD